MIQASQEKKDTQHILPLDSFPIYSRKVSKKIHSRKGRIEGDCAPGGDFTGFPSSLGASSAPEVGEGPRFRQAVYIPMPTGGIFGRLGLFLPTPELQSGSVYRCCCGFDGRRRGGEDVFQHLWKSMHR